MEMNKATNKVANREKQLEQLFNRQAEAGMFNGNVLIAEQGDVLFSGVYGCADRGTGRMLTKQSMFNVASVGKTFTAAAALLLCQQGKLSLDAEVGQWFPQLPYKPATVRHLLAHASGIPNYIRPVRLGQFGDYWHMGRLATNEEMIGRISALLPESEFAPGEGNSYSNTGYLMLAIIIEHAAQMEFGAFLQKQLFAPCGLAQTVENHDVHRSRYLSDYAIGYTRTEDGNYWLPHEEPDMEFSYYLDELRGDGNLHTTMQDLLQWDRVLRSGELLPRHMLEEAYTAYKLPSGEPAPNGLGWFVSATASGGRIVEHSGYWPGYRAVFQRYLDADRTIIMLSNEEFDGAYQEREQLTQAAQAILEQ